MTNPNEGATKEPERPQDCVVTWIDAEGKEQIRTAAHKWEWKVGSFFAKQRCMNCGKEKDA